MAVRIGSFEKTTAAAPTSQTVDGIGFKPKAAIFWTNKQVTADAWTTDANPIITVTDGTTHACAYLAAPDNGVPGNQASGLANTVLVFYDFAAPGIAAQANAITFIDDGFVLNWDINDASAYTIHYVLFGGDEWSDVSVDTWALTNFAGNQSVGPIGFRPDLVFHLGYYADAGYGCIGLGWMDSSGNQFTNGAGIGWGAGGSRGYTDSSPSLCLSVGTGTLLPFPRFQLAYVSMDASGFTINKVTVPPNPATCASLSLRGTQAFHCTSINPPGGGTPQLTSYTGVGFTPGSILFAGTDTDTLLGLASHARIMIGAVDTCGPSTGIATDFFYARAASPTQSDETRREDSCIYGGFSGPLTEVQASLDSMDADGFTLLWDAKWSTAEDYGVIAFEPTPCAGYIPPREDGLPWKSGIIVPGLVIVIEPPVV